MREGRWTRNIGEDLFGWDVHGKTLGILGFGRIGQAVARRAALGFGMPVLYHNPPAVDVPELAGRAVHTPLDELLAQRRHRRRDAAADGRTRGLMGAREFGLMKPGAIFVNGGARRHRAGSRRCWRRWTAAACAPPASTSSRPSRCRRTRRCARIPRVTALPHIGSATHETRHAMAELATSNLLQALAGERPAAVYPNPA